MIRALLVIAAAFAYTLAIGAPLLVYTVLSGNTDVIYRAGVAGARLAVWLAGVRLEVHGREKIVSERPVVYMMNHQSNCDPAAVVGLLPPVLILVKSEFFRIPVLGTGMRLRGFIPVDRRKREHARAAIHRAVDSLKSGHSFLVFPEGTRSPDGRLLPFKKGVFLMAVQASVPIVPISISGSRNVMAKGKLAIRPGVVRITFHQPVETRSISENEIGTLQFGVRDKILGGLAEAEWPEQAARSSPSRSAKPGV